MGSSRRLLSPEGVRGITRSVPLLFILLLAGCRAQPEQPQFPSAHRDVASIVGDAFSTEDARDRVGEAEEVMDLAQLKPGMSVADVGAGEGYYTVRLAPRVGQKGRVLAEDILPDVRDKLSDRIQRENLENVAVKLGTPDDPMLPAQSFDRVFLVHMYHEVQSPYAFLWHLRDGAKPGGLIVVVDANRPVKQHGIPPKQLECEFAAVGMQLVKFQPLSSGEVYFASFRLARPKPAPEQIVPCKS